MVGIQMDVPDSYLRSANSESQSESTSQIQLKTCVFFFTTIETLILCFMPDLPNWSGYHQLHLRLSLRLQNDIVNFFHSRPR